MASIAKYHNSAEKSSIFAIQKSDSNQFFFKNHYADCILSAKVVLYLAGGNRAPCFMSGGRYLFLSAKTNTTSCEVRYYLQKVPQHYSDITTSALASQITGVSMVCSTVCSDADQRKHRTSEPCHWPLWGEFPSQRASNAENVSIWWRHHEIWKSLPTANYISGIRATLTSWNANMPNNITINLLTRHPMLWTDQPKNLDHTSRL